jgi:pyruvate formate lyase activating enzyme
LLCPRCCTIKENESGHCIIRKNINGELILTAYGKASSVALDPVEKKPLFHFYPGSTVYSFGTIGCNLACEFCQNWNISKTDEMENLQVVKTPKEFVLEASKFGAKSIAFTYNDPIPFAEFAMDVSMESHKSGIKTIAVTNGYINPKPAVEFFSYMDAANVDLKSFSDDFYKKYTDSSLKPVLKTLEYIHKQNKTWLEITTLLIPGFNDSQIEIKNLTRWVFDHLGPDVPLHFSAFHPDYHFSDVPYTDLSTLIMARDIGLNSGLHYVYTGNIVDPETESTYCPNCKGKLVNRQGYRISQVNINSSGNCKFCGHKIAGIFN